MSIDLLFDYRSGLSPVQDQGERPTCVSFATSVAHEHARGVMTALSAEYLHYFAANPSKGATFPDAARALLVEGQPQEADCPYQHSEPPKDWTPPSGVQVYRRECELHHGNLGAVKDAISRGRLAVLGLTISKDFFQPEYPWKIPSDGPIVGQHAVVAVALGTSESNLHVLVRNSWGVDWGNHGHAWLGEDYLSKHLRHVMTLTNEVN